MTASDDGTEMHPPLPRRIAIGEVAERDERNDHIQHVPAKVDGGHLVKAHLRGRVGECLDEHVVRLDVGPARRHSSRRMLDHGQLLHHEPPRRRALGDADFSGRSLMVGSGSWYARTRCALPSTVARYSEPERPGLMAKTLDGGGDSGRSRCP